MNAQGKTYSRLLSLDVFRGLTIALMILVNSPGNSTSYIWLEHAPWNGCTLADLVFPFFVFIVGVSSTFSLSKTKAQGHSSLNQSVIKILKRSLIIFLLGLFLNAFPHHFEFSTLRYFGVLQRIAICYLISSLLFLTTRLEIQAGIVVFILIAYWLIMALIPLPIYGANNLTAEGNVAAYFDRLLFAPIHLYGKVYDPEGLLSTLPAVASALIGNLTGAWLLSGYSREKKLFAMSIVGVLTLVFGWVWGLWFPINKALWSSSYVLWTGGWALLILALCYWLIDIKGWKAWSKPFEIFGVNAMAAYFLHVLFLKIQINLFVSGSDGASVNLKSYITQLCFGWASPENASLLYALGYTLFWLLIMTILYRKKIFIKI